MYNLDSNLNILNITGKIISKEKKEEALCNEVYLLTAENGKFILKIAKDNIRQLELDKEYKLINNLNDKIHLPQIYLYSKEDGYSYFVMEYIDGVKPTKYTDNVLKQMAKA